MFVEPVNVQKTGVPANRLVFIGYHDFRGGLESVSGPGYTRARECSHRPRELSAGTFTTIASRLLPCAKAEASDERVRTGPWHFVAWDFVAFTLVS